jgi:hypothetical protein
MPKSKSCKKGYSRNKSTGRCRKIRKSVKSKRKCRSKKYLKLTKMSKRISKKLKKVSKNISKAAKSCRTKRKSGGRRKSPVKRNKKYQVAVEYYAPPNFTKSKLAKLDIILEAVMDEDNNGNNYYFYLVRLQAINRTNLLKYLKDIGNMKRILEVDDL